MVDFRELRIHGVGGSPGEKLLGVSGPDAAVVVGEGIDTVFLARRGQARPDEPPVEGYDWGGLTSGSVWQPLWVLLLPFTLVNVAGWSHPSFETISPGRLRLLRSLVHASAALLTAGWVLWVAIIAVDYLGYQWLAGQHGWPAWAGVLLGLFVTAVAAAALWAVAATSRTRFEHKSAVKTNSAEKFEGGDGRAAGDGSSAAGDGAHPSVQPDGWDARENLTSRWFFCHEPSMSRRLNWHVGVIVVTLLLVAVKAWMTWGQPALLLGELFVVVGAAQLGLIVALAMVSWPTAGQYPKTPRVPGVPAAAVALAVALMNGAFAGLALLTDRLVDDTDIIWGPELALVDSFVVVLAGWLLLASCYVVWFRGLAWARRLANVRVLAWFGVLALVRGQGDASELPDRGQETAQLLAGVDERMRARVAASRGLAMAGRRGPILLVAFAAVFVAASIWRTISRTTADLGQAPWQWLETPQAPTWLMRAATWLLPFLVLATMGLVWRSVRQRSLRQGVGILWDVLTFWPRRFHPLAVRPYTERAVPEFRARIEYLLEKHNGLVISAHSQGTVIAAAALQPLRTLDAEDDAKRLDRVALLTYGSPLTTLYGQVFPAYFGQTALNGLRDALEAGAGGWHNLYRRTDPIGGPVIATGTPPVDEELADPANEPEDPTDTGPEPLRRPWIELRGHSYYYRELRYKQRLTELRRSLSAYNGEQAEHQRQ